MILEALLIVFRLFTSKTKKGTKTSLGGQTLQHLKGHIGLSQNVTHVVTTFIDLSQKCNEKSCQLISLFLNIKKCIGGGGKVGEKRENFQRILHIHLHLNKNTFIQKGNRHFLFFCTKNNNYSYATQVKDNFCHSWYLITALLNIRHLEGWITCLI